MGRRHEKHDAIAALLRAGVGMQRIMAQEEVGESTVRKVRELENIPVAKLGRPIAEKPVDPDIARRAQRQLELDAAYQEWEDGQLVDGDGSTREERDAYQDAMPPRTVDEENLRLANASDYVQERLDKQMAEAQALKKAEDAARRKQLDKLTWRNGV